MKDKFEDLKGKILIKIDKTENEELVFTTHTGDKYKLCHFQDCCEDVRIEDICGDLDDLIGEPILLAEEIINEQDTHHDGVQVPKPLTNAERLAQWVLKGGIEKRRELYA